MSDNLIPFNKLTEEEQRKIATNGGIKSGQVRKEKKLISEALKDMILSGKTEFDFVDRNGKKVKQKINSEVFNKGVIAKALKGDVQAWSAIMDRIEGKVQASVDVTTGGAPLLIIDINKDKV